MLLNLQHLRKECLLLTNLQFLWIDKSKLVKELQQLILNSELNWVLTSIENIRADLGQPFFVSYRITRKWYLSKSWGIEITRNQIEYTYSNRRFMKLRTPFFVIKNALSDIRVMHDFNYEIPAETREELWKEECEIHPTSSTCKVYDD